ncbi:MAG TPA: HlyD family secretion protein [Steroidobacteraceae bacterium]|nr:HlyD family secretion protein [Steroidobacteraceae bacterium]
MEALLLGIYGFFAWLIFFKFKWLPWNTTSQVTVVVIPIVGLTSLILFLNVYAPSSADVRVIKYVVQVVPEVRGRVIEVPVEPNSPVKKGEVLFRIDPTPFQIQVRTLEAQLATTEGSVDQLREELNSAVSATKATRAKLELARLRVQQNRELASTGAGDRFALEQAEADLKQLESQLSANVAGEAQVRARLGATAGDDQAEIAEIKAKLENAKWELSQTVFYAPANGTVINLQLRPGQLATALGFQPVMTFVEDEYQVIALYDQNELREVQPGDEAEIALETYPGRIIKATVDSIVWAQGQGQVQMSGTLPQTGTRPLPAGRFAVRLKIAPQDQDLYLAAGAMGHGAIYTQHGHHIHLVRKVIMRVGSYLNWLILKLH